METIMMYLLKMFICSGILFGYYRLALYNERFHQWNRFYLLVAMLLSVIVPFISIPVFTEEEPYNMVVLIASMPWNASIVRAPLQTGVSLQDALLFALSTISIVMFLRIVINITRLFITYKTNPVNNLDNNVQLVLTQLQHAPFSFFNWLFWRQDIDPASDNGQRMLTHELTHIREHHSADKIFTEVLLCVFWMNPFFWFIRRELGTVHEFLADRRAISQQDGAAFAAMILYALQLQPSTTSGLVNPFFSSTIKRRLLMITKSKEPRYSYLRRLSGLVLMICSAMVLTLSIQQVKAQQKDKVAKKKVSAMPQKQESRTNVQVTNKPITKPGEVITIEADSIVWKKNKGEVIGVTSSGQKVKIEIPQQQEVPNEVFFKLATKGKNNLNDLEINNLKVEPLYILDEKEIAPKEFKAINPANIESINVFKGESAIAEYGDKGKYGVVKILLKNSLREVVKSPAEPANKLQEVVISGYATQKLKPYILMDGEKISSEELSTIDPRTIEKIDVIKGLKATDKYGGKAQNGVVEITIKNVKPDKVFTKAEQPAQFPGGEIGWNKYVETHLLYPETALKAGTEGVARIQFIVDEKGTITNAKILNNPGNGIGEEALRLLKESPKWQPAMQNGRVVAYQVELSITFKPTKYF